MRYTAPSTKSPSCSKFLPLFSIYSIVKNTNELYHSWKSCQLFPFKIPFWMHVTNILVILMWVRARGKSNSTQKLWNFSYSYEYCNRKPSHWTRAKTPALLISVDGSLPWKPISFQCSPYLTKVLLVILTQIYLNRAIYYVVLVIVSLERLIRSFSISDFLFLGGLRHAQSCWKNPVFGYYGYYSSSLAENG